MKPLCAQDDTLGPLLGDAPDDCNLFDFTLLFEEIFFVIVPCLLALSAIPPLVRPLGKKPKIVKWLLLQRFKLVDRSPPGHAFTSKRS